MTLNENQVEVFMQACYAVLGLHRATKTALELTKLQAEKDEDIESANNVQKIINEL